MNMKRGLLLGLLILTMAWSAAAGVRLDLTAGMSSDSDSDSVGITFVIEGAADDVVEQGSTEGSSEILAFGDVDASPQTPSLVVALSASSARVLTGETTVLEAEVSSAEDDAIFTYSWDLDGDGVFETTSCENSQEQAFADDGSITVTVRATDDAGLVELSAALDITVVNRSPAADFTLPETVVEGTRLQFIDASTDDDGEVVAWLWSFGDGTTSTERNPEHTYATAGEYSVTLTVTDDDGDTSALVSPAIAIANASPTASFSIQQTAVAGTQSLILVDESSDPSPSGEIIHLAWDFGDGTYVSGSLSDEDTYAHLYAVPGTYVVTLYVIDNDGALALVSRTITVS